MPMDDATMNLLMQYLSSAGQDIGAGKPIGANVNAVTQQQVSARSYSNLLKNLLSNGGKMSVDKDNVSIKAPTNAFGQGQSVGQKGPDLPSGYENPAATEQKRLNADYGISQVPSNTGGGLSSEYVKNLLLGGGSGGSNPTSSPLENISGAALAGLTPQDISQALRFKFAQDEVVRTEAMERSRNEIAQRRLDIDEAKLNREYNTTADIKNYQYAVAQGYSGSFDEFRNSTATAGIKEYEYAVRQGYSGSMEQWKTDLAKAARSQINIGDKVEAAEAMEGVKNRNYFIDPKGGLVDDVRKYMSDKNTENEVLMKGLAPGTPEYVKERSKQRVKFVESKLIQAFGEDSIVDARFADEKKTKVTWRVRTDKGVKEYTYGISD